MYPIAELMTQTGPVRASRRLHEALAETKGLHMSTAYEGVLSAGAHDAALRVEPGGCIALSLAVDSRPQPVQAMETNFHLPGNVRFAVQPSGAVLLADSLVGDSAHLPRTLAEMGEGFQQALSKRPADRRCQDTEHGRCKDIASLEPGQVEALLKKSNWDEGAVVRNEAAWELRPRLREEVIPLELAIRGFELRLHRKVFATAPSQEALAPLAAQALRINSSLRHARLAMEEGRLVAETRLHRGLLEPLALAAAAYAVAAAYQYSQTALRILAEEEVVARCYRSLFLV
jgi:hypothetical protein